MTGYSQHVEIVKLQLESVLQHHQLSATLRYSTYISPQHTKRYPSTLLLCLTNSLPFISMSSSLRHFSADLPPARAGCVRPSSLRPFTARFILSPRRCPSDSVAMRDHATRADWADTRAVFTATHNSILDGTWPPQRCVLGISRTRCLGRWLRNWRRADPVLCGGETANRIPRLKVLQVQITRSGLLG